MDSMNICQDNGSAPATCKVDGLPLLGRFISRFSKSPVPFEMILPNGSILHFGQGVPSFRLALKNRRALRAIASLDEVRFGDAYLNGDFDIEGDMLSLFQLRASMEDVHPLTTAWRFVQPLLIGQVQTNQRAITAHYDVDAEFFLSFLDPNTPCYTQGVFEDPSETLDVATLRKFDYCFEKCQLKPGDHLLEIGPGWGAWMEYASRRGVKCTGITNSHASVEFLRRRGLQLGFDWDVIHADLLEYDTDRKYDAIIVMGVIEHLPQYDLVLDKIQFLLKPARYLFLDGSACTKKYEISAYMTKYIFGGNHSFLVLSDLLDAMSKKYLDAIEITSDRESYFLTFQQWARNFDRNSDFVIERFGEFNYRRFRLYLWGAAFEFASRSLNCYRMVVRSTGEREVARERRPFTQLACPRALAVEPI